MECIFKIIAKGFICHPKSYLRDWWNIIDFVVVISAILEFLPLGSESASFRGIRSIRAIRPLRSINAIPSMKKLVKILLKSLPNLFNVVMLLAFMMLMFGILGLNFFCGNLYYRCRTTPAPLNSTYWPILEGYEHLCQQNPDTCPTGSYCGHPSQYNISLKYENISSTEFIQYGIVQFDNIGHSILTVFQVLTVFGWSEIMYNFMESTNEYFSAIFFSTIVLFGAFFLLNLILAVIIDAYNKIDMKEKKKEEQRLEQEAKGREKKFEALKTMYRMMKLSQQKREIIESAGMKFRWSFFDCVFELVRVERYEKVVNPKKSPEKKSADKIRDHLQNKLSVMSGVLQFDDSSQPSSSSPRKGGSTPSQSEQQYASFMQPMPLLPLITIKEDQFEEDEEEQKTQKFLFGQTSDKLLEPMEISSQTNTNSNGPYFNIHSFIQKRTNTPGQQIETTGVARFTKILTQNLDDSGSTTALNIGSFTGADDSSFLRGEESSFIGIEAKARPKFDHSLRIQARKSSIMDNPDAQEQSPDFRSRASSRKFSQRMSITTIVASSLQKSLNHKEQGLDIKPKQKRCCHFRIKCWEKLRDCCLQIIITNWFKYMMTGLIISNTIVMAFVRYPISSNEKKFEEIANFIFYICFCLEMILKLLGLGIKCYFKDGFNIFDCSIILISTADIISNTIYNNSKSSTLSILRGFRILRILKIAKNQQQMQDFQQTIGKTLVDLRNFSVLLFLLVFTYTLLGLEFFAYKMKFDENDNYDLLNGTSPSQNFDGFYKALLTVFNILQGEGYFSIMYNIARSVGEVSILFFVTLIVFGNIILLKLFLAVLLDNFEDKRKEIEDLKKTIVHKPLSKRIKTFFIKIKQKYFKCRCFQNKDELYLEEDQKEEEIQQQQQELIGGQITRSKSKSISIKTVVVENKSLYLFKSTNRFRLQLMRIATSKIFEYSILGLILASSIFMAIQNPLDDPNSTKNTVLFYCDIVVTTIFSLEVLIKVIAEGFVLNGPKSYLRSWWNILDFIIVSVSLISLCASSNNNLKIFKVLRLLRVLRPLRVIGRNQGLKLALSTMFMAVPHIANVLFVCLIFYLLFGIFCVSFLQGQYYYCYYDQLEEFGVIVDPTSIITKFDCINIGGEWVNHILNFDNALNAMEQLYTISMVSWNQRMFTAVNAAGIGMQPIENHNPWWALYFVIFMIMFVFFLLNLFVGVVVSTFNTEKERAGKNFLLTDTQKEWLHMKIMLLSTKPVIKKILSTSNPVRKICFLMINHPAFEWIIFACIVLNTVLLTINWYLITDEIVLIVSYLNYFFSAIFVLEATIKIIAMGPVYFRDSWNKFDFLIVIATLIGIILDLTTQVAVGGKATIIRAFRVARIFRIIKRAQVLKIIIDTLIVTLPSLMNVGGLLLLIIYIYSVLGMQLFSGIKLQDNLNERANFQSFGRSFLTMIRVATGEEWDFLLEDMTEGFSIINQCDENFNYTVYMDTGVTNGCGVGFAHIYILSFNLIVAVVFLNLFVAIVLESFSEMNQKENKLLSDKNMDKLRHCWAEYDQEGTFFIKIPDLLPFLVMLEEPLGFNELERNSLKLQDDFMKHLELPTYNSMKHFYYYDVVQVLTQYAYLKIEAERKLKKKLMKDDFNFQKHSAFWKPSADLLTSIKNELDFRSEIFRKKEIVAFKEAMDKEKKLYSKMGAVKDDLDSQHFWAGDKIKNMYGKTNMNFKGGLLNQKSMDRQKQELEIRRLETQNLQLQQTQSQIDMQSRFQGIRVENLDAMEDRQPDLKMLRDMSIMTDKSLSYNDNTLNNNMIPPSPGIHPTNQIGQLQKQTTVSQQFGRRKSLWKVMSSAIGSEDDMIIPEPKNVKRNSVNQGNNNPADLGFRRKSSILFQMIAKTPHDVISKQSNNILDTIQATPTLAHEESVIDEEQKTIPVVQEVEIINQQQMLQQQQQDLQDQQRYLKQEEMLKQLEIEHKQRQQMLQEQQEKRAAVEKQKSRQESKLKNSKIPSSLYSSSPSKSVQSVSSASSSSSIKVESDHSSNSVSNSSNKISQKDEGYTFGGVLLTQPKMMNMNSEVITSKDSSMTQAAIPAHNFSQPKQKTFHIQKSYNVMMSPQINTTRRGGSKQQNQQPRRFVDLESSYQYRIQGANDRSNLIQDDQITQNTGTNNIVARDIERRRKSNSSQVLNIEHINQSSGYGTLLTIANVNPNQIQNQQTMVNLNKQLSQQSYLEHMPSSIRSSQILQQTLYPQLSTELNDDNRPVALNNNQWIQELDKMINEVNEDEESQQSNMSKLSQTNRSKLLSNFDGGIFGSDFKLVESSPRQVINKGITKKIIRKDTLQKGNDDQIKEIFNKDIEISSQDEVESVIQSSRDGEEVESVIQSSSLNQF